jgi:putative copper export protein
MPGSRFARMLMIVVAIVVIVGMLASIAAVPPAVGQ